jgi:hypothetical protein
MASQASVGTLSRPTNVVGCGTRNEAHKGSRQAVFLLSAHEYRDVRSHLSSEPGSRTTGCNRCCSASLQ